MKKKLLAFITICSFSSSIAFADGWTPNSMVTKIVVLSDGGINVRLTPDVNNCVSQGGYGPNFVSVPPTHPAINKIKADLLAAYLSDKAISIYINNTCIASELILGGW